MFVFGYYNEMKDRILRPLGPKNPEISTKRIFYHIDKNFKTKKCSMGHKEEKRRQRMTI